MDRLPPGLPPVYFALLKKLELSDAVEAVQRALNRAFVVDAGDRSEADEAVLRILLCLRLAGGALRAKDISAQVLKSTSHVSRLIDRAEKQGLVERQSDPSDRRAYQVVLTDVGQAQIDAYVPHAVALFEGVYGNALDGAETAAVIEMLGRVEKSVLEWVADRER